MKIKSIEEATFSTGEYSGYDGIVVTLENDQQIKVGISNGQSCCENFGYVTSHDKFDDFIDAEYIDSRITDEALNTVEVPEIYNGGMTFFTIETSKGPFQLVAYNEHNGYYSHRAVLIVNDVIKADEIF